MGELKLGHVLLVGMCVLGWIGVARHPTARGLRAAIVDTLPLL